MAARDSRDKKGVERFVPPEEQQEKGKQAISEVNPEVLKTTSSHIGAWRLHVD